MSLTQAEIHEKILYPVTKVMAGTSGGSGVLVYSKEDPKKPGEYINIALTCQHVIDGAIKVSEQWDNILKKDVKTDVLEEVRIEVFDYDRSKVVSANSSTAQIIAYDKHHDQKAYLMQNAPSIFGNSGGGLFHGESGHLLGLTSRITSTQLGFGIDIMTWMGFSTHPDRLYEFFDHQELQFLYDENDNYHDALHRRESRRHEALRNLLFESTGESLQ